MALSSHWDKTQVQLLYRAIPVDCQESLGGEDPNVLINILKHA